MSRKGVYQIFYDGNKNKLTVQNGDTSVPMAEFLQTHTPVQVTGLTHTSPNVPAGQGFMALMIAEETPSEAL